MAKEMKLTKDFITFLRKRYKKKVDIFNVFSCGMGKNGQPDLQVTFAGYTYYVELKDSKTLKASWNECKRRRYQLPRMHELRMAKAPVFILYRGGCALLEGEDPFNLEHWKDFSDEEDFMSFVESSRYFHSQLVLKMVENNGEYTL